MNAQDKLRLWSTAIVTFRDTLFDVVRFILQDNAPYFEEFITVDQMLLKGVEGSGKQIRPAYTPYTVSIKRMLGQTTTHVTLKDSGDFHASVTLVADATSFHFSSDDPKADYLIEKYGSDVLNLTEDNVSSVVWDFIFSTLLDNLKTEIYGEIV